VTELAPPPEPAVVEWGGERRGVLDRLISFRGWHPAVPWVLAGLGAIAMFGSLVGEWQVVERSFVEIPSEDTIGSEPLGIAYTLVWGMAWVIGGMLLAVCCGVALTGAPAIRPAVRTIGLAVAAVDLGLLAAAAASLDESLFVGPPSETEIALGRGVYAAFASVLLIGAAIYLARTRPSRVRPEPEPVAAGDGPADLAVGPAEPRLGGMRGAEPPAGTDTLQG
jgi:hypothetical protein